MAPKGKQQQGSRRRPPQGGPGGRRKSCYFCKDKVVEVDYKNVNQLRRYISEKGKITPRRISGVCTIHQRLLTGAIKQARNIALLPFSTAA